MRAQFQSVTSMRVQAILLSLAMLGLLGACRGQPTPYQPVVDGYGYSEQRLEDNRYRVTFAGNDFTKADTVQNYLLCRTAELTLNHGYDYFTVVDRNLERSTRYSGSSSTSGSPGYITEDGDYVGGYSFSTYSADPIDRYTAYADMVMFNGEKPASDIHAYDARSVLRQLSPSIAVAPGVMRRAPEQPESQQQTPQQ
ncbi:MAG: CC0125/CC1285 family lipoprotein [Geminicoccaceae bacterium]